MSRGALKKGGAKIERTYRIYDWDPEGDGAAEAAPA
jgi:hypothetical protein